MSKLFIVIKWLSHKLIRFKIVTFQNKFIFKFLNYHFCRVVLLPIESIDFAVEEIFWELCNYMSTKGMLRRC